MIQSLQKFSQSRVAKIFLAIVALSFVAFFGGGNFFRPHDTTAVIAEVGHMSIGRMEFAERVREQVQRLSAESGEQISKEDLLESGIPQMVLNHLVQNVLLNLEAESLGLVVSDETILAQLQSMKAFQNKKGQFDRNMFNQILRSNGMSEDTFIAEIRQELIREELSNAVMVGAFVPDVMLDRLFDAEFQQRQASELKISFKDIPAPADPSSDVLEAFFKDHEKNFETPELRTISALIISPAHLLNEMPVTDEEMKATYEAKSDSFGHKPYEEVKDLVKLDVQKEKANEEIYKITQELDDKIAGGSTFEELAPHTKGASLVKLEAVDAKGRDRVGVPSTALPQDDELSDEILQTAFSLDDAADSPFSQAKSGAYYTVRVDTITPQAVQPFAEVKEKVLRVWKESQQKLAAQKKAEEYVDAFNNGNKAVSLMTLLPNLSMSEPNDTVPHEIQNLVFSLRPGKAAMTRVPDGYSVVVLNTIIPPKPGIKEEKIATFKESIVQQYKQDILNAYINALRISYPVKINSEAFKTVVGQ